MAYRHSPQILLSTLFVCLFLNFPIPPIFLTLSITSEHEENMDCLDNWAKLPTQSMHLFPISATISASISSVRENASS